MKLELFVALRYLKAKRKQAVISIVTMISVIGIAAGVAALIIALSLNTGFQEEFQKRILGATSHVNVIGAGATAISDYKNVMEELAEIYPVQGMTATIYGQALLQYGIRQEPAVLKGLVPGKATELDGIIPPIVEGEMFEVRSQNTEYRSQKSSSSALRAMGDGEEGIKNNEERITNDEEVRTNEGAGISSGEGVQNLIILGKDLANSLLVSPGEYIRVVGLQGELSPLGRMPRIKNFRVIGIFESGLYEFDANWALIPLDAAQEFFGLQENEVSAIELKIEDIFAAPDVAGKIKTELAGNYSTSTWIELNQPLFSALELEKLAMFLAIGLIVLVASLNIVCSLTLMVMDKNRDIAIIQSMGGTTRTITHVFMLQGLLIGVLGTIIGDILGVLSVWYFDTYQIFQLEAQVYSIPFVYVTVFMSPH